MLAVFSLHTSTNHNLKRSYDSKINAVFLVVWEHWFKENILVTVVKFSVWYLMIAIPYVNAYKGSTKETESCWVHQLLVSLAHWAFSLLLWGCNKGNKYKSRNVSFENKFMIKSLSNLPKQHFFGSFSCMDSWRSNSWNFDMSIQFLHIFLGVPRITLP